ncbi:hybrid sensor histidine kinase/response regulator transcription factor [Alteromonas sp. BMJM2]|uniref:hybrid sensor histidine kinase/response regulator transcription factor n=1 Tax=Alteromonas sp. BMJM2 TaxID=2954241 RepID=UPI0022B3730E|nr:ATP-binding protein [Alteromonas sp. BMJM2]
MIGFRVGAVSILVLFIPFSLFIDDVYAESLEGRTVFAGTPAGVIRDVEVNLDKVYIAAENGVFEIAGALTQQLQFNVKGTETGIISDIYLDGKYLWIIEYGVGVFKLNLQTRKAEKVFSEYGWSKSVWSLSITDRHIAFSIINNIIVIDKETNTPSPVNRQINAITVQDAYSIDTSSGDEFIIATRDSFVTISPLSNRVKRVVLSEDLPALSYATFVREIDGNIYLGGDGGFYIIESEISNSRFVQVKRDTLQNIEFINKSKEGELWVSDGTLWQFKAGVLERPQFMNPLVGSESINTIVKVVDGPQGSLIIASSQLGLLTLSDSQRAINLVSFNSISLRDNIRDVFVDPKRILVKTSNGVFELEKQSGEMTKIIGSSQYEEGCLSYEERVFSHSLSASRESFCSSSYRHVVRVNETQHYIYYDDGNNAHYYAVSSNEIVDQFDAPRFLVSSSLLSSGELAAFDAFDNIHFQLSKFSWRKIKSEEARWQGIQCLLEQVDFFILCTSGAGLKLISKKSGEISNFDDFDNFGLRFIRGGVVSTAGNLWIATNMGLFVYPSDGSEAIKLTKTEGIFDIDFEYKGVVDLGGRLLILGDKYSYIIDEKPFLKQLHQKDLSNVNVIVTHVEWSNGEDSHTIYFPEKHSFKFPNSFSNASIGFVSDSFLYNEAHTLEYRFDRDGGDWIAHAEADMVISLSDLSFGDHFVQVRVKSSNSLTGIATLQFNIAPPIWLSPFALLFYAILFMLLFISWRVGYLKPMIENWKKTPLYRQLTRYEITDGESKFEKMLKSKERHISEITHELKTPIQIIQGTLSKVNEKTTESDGVLKSIQLNMKRVEQLVDQMQKDSPRASAVSDYFTNYTTEKMAHIVNALEPLAKAKRQNLEMRVKGDGTVSLINDSLEKIVVNLVENAIKYTPELGTIKVVFAIEAKTFKLTVTDNGSGIAKEEHDRVFERFVRLSSDEKGDGLGLSIVKNLVELNQGEILLDSKQGGGTKISTVFPIDDTEYINAQLSIKDVTDWQGDRKTLLIVDDSREFRTYLFNLLSPKYRCLVAKNGKQALEVLRSHLVSLVICDQMMGKFDGLSLSKEIREHDSLGGTPILMLTASSDAAIEQAALEIKVDYYLMKPSSNQEIEMRVEHLILLRDTSVKPDGNVTTEPFKYGCLNIPEFKTEKDMAFYLNFIAVLENHYQDEEFDRERAAQALLISPRSLNRRMAELFDYNFSEFLSRYRIEKSIPILLEGSSILNACLDVGFATSAYFSTTFKKIMGVPPKKFVELRGNRSIS